MIIRSKSVISLLVFSILLSSFFLLEAAAENTGTQGQRYKTTVMVYLCGSNLESRLGAATKDLYEMMQSGFDDTCTDVIVMAGGSKLWKNGLDASKTSIMELHGRGMRTVWQSEEALNMSESSTLSTFLDYVYEHYRSDRYALILWDHGGGPNEGACYDELFPGQSLTLPEIRDALREQNINSYGRELSWIGFDACLMANLETAYVLQPFTDYLIASQAEEPSTGWNYDFLKGLESDSNAESTARRIVDCFAEQDPGENTQLTLSCVRLGKIKAVLNSVNNLFGMQFANLSEETFPDYSNERYRMLDFGSTGDKGAGSFDLVDLCSLAEAYGENTPELETLKNTVRDAVVYSRSTVEGASGLSVYHPYFDPESYEKMWSDSYAQYFGDMSQNYARYIRYFNRILTGESLTSWAGLETWRTVEPNGDVRFSVTLSEEQAKQFVHADFRILQQENTINGGYGESYTQIWDTADVAIDDSRTISAVFPGKAMFVIDDQTGENLAGPIDFIRTEEDKLVVYVLFSDENGIMDPELLSTEYRCDYQQETGIVTVDSVCAKDELTGEFSARMTLDEEFFRQSDYSTAVFWHYNVIPAYRGDELQGLKDWERDGTVYYSPVSLPRSWHFEIRDIGESPDLVCALFQITDTQNETHCSSLTRIFPELTEEYEASGQASGEVDSLSVEEIVVRHYLSEDGLYLRLRLQGLPADYENMEAENVILNDTVMMNQLRDFSSNDRIQLTLKKEMTCGISELRRVAFDLELSNGNYREEKMAHVVIELAEPVPLEREDIHPLAECETNDGLQWRIWGVNQIMTGNLQVSCDVRNPGKEDQSVDINDVIFENYDSRNGWNSFDLPAGKTAFMTLDADQTKSDIDSNLSVITTVYEPLAQLGINRIGKIQLLYKDGSIYPAEEYTAVFSLQESVSYAPILPERIVEREIVAEAEVFRVESGQITAYHEAKLDADMLSVGLWLYNNSDTEHEFFFDCFAVDGTRVLSDDYWSGDPSFNVRADTVQLGFLHMTLPAGTEMPGEVSFDFFVDDVFVQHIVVKVGDQHLA